MTKAKKEKIKCEKHVFAKKNKYLRVCFHFNVITWY